MHRRLLPLLLLAAGALACGGYGRPNEPNSQLAFGTSMAQRGLWSEALFRFHEAERLDPENPHVQNNLGVAYEATGEFDKALQHYQRALKLAPQDRQVKNNYARFVEFYQSFRPKQAKEQGLVPPMRPGARPTPGTPGATGTAGNGVGAIPPPPVAPADQPAPPVQLPDDPSAPPPPAP